MKTIRTNCFETNSSSTHSVTIESKSRVMKEDKDLVINGVLQPENLRYTSAYRASGYGGDGHTLHATTRDQKAALLICHIASIDNAGRASKPAVAKMLRIAKDMLIEKCGYTDVKIDDLNYHPFTCYDENESTYLDRILNDADYSDSIDEEEVAKGLRLHVGSVILNDDAIIIDSEESN